MKSSNWSQKQKSMVLSRVRDCLNAVGQSRASKVKEQQQKRGHAGAANKRVNGVYRAGCSVKVSVHEATNNEHGQLSNEEAHEDQGQHRPNGLPRCGNSPNRQCLRRWRQWNRRQVKRVVVGLHGITESSSRSVRPSIVTEKQHSAAAFIIAGKRKTTASLHQACA